MVTEQTTATDLANWLFNIDSEEAFEEAALQIFRYQAAKNPVYKAFCAAIGRGEKTVQQVSDIPFLPIQFFKSQAVKSGEFEPEAIFRSSGTTASTTSRHLIRNVNLYRQSFSACFQQFYGSPKQYCILGLLPSYLEQGQSSLVFMVDDLIKQSQHPDSGFYLYNYEQLSRLLVRLEARQQPVILFGVSYALLDFADRHPQLLKSTTVIETGGMKGRRKELLKEELYKQLQTAFATPAIHSEYGMTELLSQAYAVNGVYKAPPWMKIILREETDPFNVNITSGAINVIDLANIHSCSFIATDDRGRLLPDGRFEVLGRIDNSDVRGCSQLFAGQA